MSSSDDFLSILQMHKDDFDSHERGFEFVIGDKIQKFSSFLKPTISYTYLNLGLIPQYCFIQPDFTDTDYKLYFDNIKKITSLDYDTLIHNKDKKLDFSIYSYPNGKLLDIFKNIIGRSKISPEQIPTFGRIGLYNSTPLEKKAPRIYFFVGHNCVLHILFFDPFHSVYPEKKAFS